MTLDERNYHSYHLPERVKEARLRTIQRRFKAATPKRPRRKGTDFVINIPVPETRTDWILLYTVVCLFFLGTTFIFWYIR